MLGGGSIRVWGGVRERGGGGAEWETEQGRETDGQGEKERIKGEGKRGTER